MDANDYDGPIPFFFDTTATYTATIGVLCVCWRAYRHCNNFQASIIIIYHQTVIDHFCIFFLFFISRSRVLCMFLFTFPVILPTHSTVFRRYICICMYNVYMSDPDYCNIIRLSHTHSDSPPSLFIKLIVVNSPTTKEEKVIQNRLSSSRWNPIHYPFRF